MIGVVIGPTDPRDYDPNHWRGGIGPVVHAPAAHWSGPACNLGVDPAVKLIPGQEVEVERLTCGACRHPGGALCDSPDCGPCRRQRARTDLTGVAA